MEVHAHPVGHIAVANTDLRISVAQRATRARRSERAGMSEGERFARSPESARCSCRSTRAFAPATWPTS
jgi:hypothetical protein